MSETLRHIHTDITDRLRQMDPPPAWVRKVTVDVPAAIVNNEKTAFPQSYVELWTSMILEQPGFPPMAGVATETDIVSLEDVEDGSEEKTFSLTIYYFSHYELGDATLTSDAFYDPGRAYHEDEEMVDFPKWVLYPDPYEDAYAEQATTVAENASGPEVGDADGEENSRAQ